MTAKETSPPHDKSGRLPRKGLSPKDRAREKNLGIINSSGHVDMSVVNKLHHHSSYSSSSKNKVTPAQDNAKGKYDALSEAKKNAIMKAAQKGGK